MKSENPTGADNQQGSRRRASSTRLLTPQRLHAELLATDTEDLEVYLQGALKDGTYNEFHDTHRFGQADVRWLKVLELGFDLLGHRSWIYREGRKRQFWVLETSADFLSTGFDASPLVGSHSGIHYARGYFDAEGGMPRSSSARLYLQFGQKNFRDLDVLAGILESWSIRCGRIHNPSRRVDPFYWRFYVANESHQRFMRVVGSWHPRKRQQMATRMVR